jgi:hypothetical protein
LASADTDAQQGPSKLMSVLSMALSSCIHHGRKQQDMSDKLSNTLFSQAGSSCFMHDNYPNQLLLTLQTCYNLLALEI